MKYAAMIAIMGSAFVMLAPARALAKDGKSAATTCRAQYIGDLVVKAEKDGRTMSLMKPYGFRDSSCKEWKVPDRAVVDGASIPSILWSLVGGPFDDKYRNASVIHDWYCDVRTERWRAVHHMFYEGMIASGVEERKAALMYLGVYYFGPRWTEMAIKNTRRLLSEADKKITPAFQKALDAILSSLESASLPELTNAVKTMNTAADQYALSSALAQFAAANDDKVLAINAIDGMISSNIPTDGEQSQLFAKKASYQLMIGNLEEASDAVQRAIRSDPSNAVAVDLISKMRSSRLLRVDHDNSEYVPNIIEFERMRNIVETQNMSVSEIEDLVDTFRPDKDKGKERVF
jgi:hypothetical protein